MSGREIDEDDGAVTVYCPFCGQGLAAAVARGEGGERDEEDWQAEVEKHGCLSGYTVDWDDLERVAILKARSC